MEELWKRIDPTRQRTELDRISEYIEGLRPEFIVPVQSTMPQTVAEAINKAKATETAFSMELIFLLTQLIQDIYQIYMVQQYLLKLLTWHSCQE